MCWNWQTRRTQNPLMATSCGFDPHHRHQAYLSGFYRLGIFCFTDKSSGLSATFAPNGRQNGFIFRWFWRTTLPSGVFLLSDFSLRRFYFFGKHSFHNITKPIAKISRNAPKKNAISKYSLEKTMCHNLYFHFPFQANKKTLRWLFQ